MQVLRSDFVHTNVSAEEACIVVRVRHAVSNVDCPPRSKLGLLAHLLLCGDDHLPDTVCISL